jgi:hypothetical protein
MSKITILTTAGRNLLAGAIANAQAIPSAKIVVGDGDGATYVPVASQVALVNQVWTSDATVTVTEDKVFFQATIPVEDGPFTVREAGVLLGEVGAEQLFIVSQYNVTEKLASPANGAGPLTVTIGFSAAASEIAVLPVSQGTNAMLALASVPHITVLDRVTATPAVPADGDIYAVATGATGIFSGKGGQLAERVAGAWLFKQPPVHSIIRLASDGSWKERSGADWVPYAFPSAAIAWNDVTGKPASFPPSAHAHVISDVDTLQAALDGKAPTTRSLSTDGIIRIDGGSLANLSANRALSIDLNALRAALGVGRKLIAVGALTAYNQNVAFAAPEPDTGYSGTALFVVPISDGGQNTIGATADATSKTSTGCAFQSPVLSGNPASYGGIYIIWR